MSLLEVRNLSVTFPVREGILEAVKDVSFDLGAGETLGIVGESGSGKSVCVSTLLGLTPASAGMSGSARFDGEELIGRKASEWRRIRGRRISMIFQDPMTSLTPHRRVADQVGEPLRIHRGMSRKEARRRAIEAMEAVGIPNAANRADAWPHEFSGGMRQRVMIAMAMISEPEILIADEPTTALDVTVQRQILELIARLRRERGTAVLFISHDLAVVAEVSARIMVMRKGRVVETGATAEVMAAPRHPYTRGLLKCHPALHEPGTRLPVLEDVMQDGIAPTAHTSRPSPEPKDGGGAT